MTQPAKSYERVHYEFRPAKQVERRMLMAAFQKLMEAGFALSEYQYTGLGSIYFIDFVLLHRYLGISRMVSVEHSAEIRNRVHFNKPYGGVEIYIGDVADYIPQLSADRKHILWLDFDHVVSKEMLESIVLACAQLSAGSVLLVTVDVEPPGEKTDGPKQWRGHFLAEAKGYLGGEMRKSRFSRSKLLSVNAGIIQRCIAHGLEGRSDVEFCPLFNFLYADGHQMLSVGGMIGAADDRRRLSSIRRGCLPFLRDSITQSPFEIRVPLVTRKERLHLDSAMPCGATWRPKAFEMKPEDIQAYRDIYPYFPAYTEMLL